MVAIIMNIIGYASSILTLASYCVKNIKTLRMISIVGGVGFIAYSIYTHTYPNLLLNVCCEVVNIYNLVKITREEKAAKQNKETVESVMGNCTPLELNDLAELSA